MPPQTEFGAVREVWFAKVADPATKWSFLVRDDAGAKSGAVFGRTLRLGDPITTGPASVWHTKSWEGGLDQEHWRDEAMYKTGTADTARNPGRARLPLRIRCIHSEKIRGVTGYVFSPGTAGFGADTRLWFGETNNEPTRNDPTTGTQIPPTGYRLYHYNPSDAVVTNFKGDHNGYITNITRMSSDAVPTSRYLVYTSVAPSTGATSIHTLNDTLPSYQGIEWTHPAGYPIPVNSAVVYADANWWGTGTWLLKRVNLPTGLPLHSVAKAFLWANQVRALTVWNNRIWMVVQRAGGDSMVFASDGITAVPAFEMPQSFVVRRLVVHYGSLYIVGYRQYGNASQGAVGEVWRYNGSSLSRLWSKSIDGDTKNWGIYDAVSWNQFLVWTVPAHTPATDKFGLYFYDADIDAISPGPSMDMHASATDYVAQNLSVYNNQLVFSGWDSRNYSATVNQPSGVFLVESGLNGLKVRTKVVAAAYEGFSFESQSATLERSVLSSVYAGEGGTQSENKTWLAVRVLVKIAEADASIVVKAILNEGTSYTLGTITYDATKLGWREVVFPVKSAGDYLTSHNIQYELLLRNTAVSVESTSNPEVDRLAVEYVVKPAKRRQWNMRAVLQDAQLRLDTTANPLTTMTALKDKLEELWSDGKPIILWEPNAVGGAPAGAGTEVLVSQYSETTYRLDTAQSVTDGEVGLTLVEIVSS